MAKPVRRTSKKAQVPIALGGRYLEPSLPLPWVEYPSHYGAFFRFAEEANGPYVFCSCIREAAELYIKHHAYGGPLLFFFSNEVRQSVQSTDDLLALIGTARDNLCHRCNLAPPSRRFCHEMYGGAWRQHYGWYQNIAYLESGIHPIRTQPFLNSVPDELHEVFKRFIELTALRATLITLEGTATDDAKRAFHTRLDGDKELARLKHAIDRYFENIARTWFRFPLVGDGWISETRMFHIIQEIYPNEKLVRHHRPSWLEGLELDVFVPDHMIAFEYQGEQHRKPMKQWGGRVAFDALRLRDERKKWLCDQHGCKLIELWFDEPLSLDHLRSKVRAL
jgi:hypothetical protein